MKKLNNIKDKNKRHKFFVISGMIYNYIFGVGKIIFGILILNLLYSLSGINTCLIGVSKNIYIKNLDQKRKIAPIIISSFIMFNSVSFFSKSLLICISFELNSPISVFKTDLLDTIDFSVVQTKELGYRNRARFHLMELNRETYVPGFQMRNSNEIIPVQNCPCLDSTINNILKNNKLSERINESLKTATKKEIYGYKKDGIHVFGSPRGGG